MAEDDQVWDLLTGENFLRIVWCPAEPSSGGLEGRYQVELGSEDMALTRAEVRDLATHLMAHLWGANFPGDS